MKIDSIEVQRLKHRVRYLTSEVKFLEGETKLLEKQLKEAMIEIEKLKEQK